MQFSSKYQGNLNYTIQILRFSITKLYFYMKYKALEIYKFKSICNLWLYFQFCAVGASS